MIDPPTKLPGPAAGRGFPESIRKRYSALVCGDGRVLPIIERVGRRVIREIDPSSREGRRLLEERKVSLQSATRGSEPTGPIPWRPSRRIPPDS